MRKRAEKLAREIAPIPCVKYLESNGNIDAWIKTTKRKIEAELTAAVREEREKRGAAVRKAHKAGWESAMYDAHVNYGADKDETAPKLTDADVAALLTEEK